MDWYIFLTPLLLLPIIFLFRLVGCALDSSGVPGDGDDGDDGGRLIEKTFIFKLVNTIPIVQPNPIKYIWPTFTIDDGEPIGSPQLVDHPPQESFTPEAGLGPFTIESFPANAAPGAHGCSCDVYITRVGIDVNPDEPLFTTDHRLIDPVVVETSDDVITFHLYYAPTSVPAIDYPAGDFLLTTQPPINITFEFNIADPIPSILPNPIIWIWPKFRVDGGGSGPSVPYVSHPMLGETGPPFTFKSVAIQVPAGPHTCYCDVFMLRLDIDVTAADSQETIESINDNPDQAVGQHLTGPAIVDPQTGFVADTVITFNLHYTQSVENDYLPEDFSIEIDIA
jgi:hypothetical protein